MTYHVEDPPKEAAAKERKRPEVDRLLRQFLKIETGLGNSPEFQRGWVWNFEWNSSDPKKAKPDLVQAVKYGMDLGMDFETAFDCVHAAADQIVEMLPSEVVNMLDGLVKVE